MGAGLDSARSAIAGSDPYPPPLYAQDGATLHYKRWFSCYRPVFLGKPKEMGEAHCGRLRSMGADISLSSAGAAGGSASGAVPNHLRELARSVAYQAAVGT